MITKNLHLEAELLLLNELLLAEEELLCINVGNRHT